jgi:L-ascorbate metabolism protein UlaG (beta-lactamase superfamily)
MLKPVQQDEEFLQDVRQARSQADRLHLWWLGQSGFLVQWQGRHLLLDPYLSNSLTRKYANTDKPHTRLTERVVEPERLDFIEVVTASHQHTDHLDAETLQPILAKNPGVVLVVPEALREFAAERLGVSESRLTCLDAGQSHEAAGFKLHAIPAAHNALERNGAGHYRFLGYVVQAGPWTLYHSGDTLRYPGLEEWLRPWRLDLVLLPINGDKPERRVAGNLDGSQAATLAKQVGAGLVIPCHYEMFAFNTAAPDEFAAKCRELGQTFRLLRAGERWSAEGPPG